MTGIANPINAVLHHVQDFLGMKRTPKAQTVAALAGSVAVVEHGLELLGATVFSELKVAIQAAAEAAFKAATGDHLAKLQAAGKAGLQAGLNFFEQGDLEHVAADVVSNIVHALATSLATEIGAK